MDGRRGRPDRLKNMKILYSILISLVFLTVAFGQERYVKPFDEAAKDPSFLAFRTKLIAAAEKRDARFILSIIDPKIELSFGGDSGTADFKRIWKVATKGSKFWDVFLPIIKNGGRFDRVGRKGKSFSAPYTFSGLPEDLDFTEYLMIFGNNVNLRETPKPDSVIVDQLSYNVVKIDEPSSTRTKTGSGENDWEYDWYKVETLGGKKGFVKAEFVRSAIDYRAVFEKKGGVWKMVALIAGD